MRIGMFSLGGEARLGVVAEELGEKVVDLLPAFALSLEGGSPAERLARARREVPEDCLAFLRQPERGRAAAERALEAVGREGEGEGATFDGLPLLWEPARVRILPPLIPSKVLAMARNYRAHAEEFDRILKRDQPPPVRLYAFLKPPSSVSGAYDPVVVAEEVEKLDYEVELGAVIGKRGRHIPEERALEHVGAYTVVNDISDRAGLPDAKAGKWPDWFLMKSQDTMAPLGPYLLLADGSFDPQALDLRLWVNRELRQDSNTRFMIYNIAQQVTYLSRVATLEVGDVIATGSPEGNAASWGKWLQAGDVVECEVERVGRQRFTIQKEKAAYRPG